MNWWQAVVLGIVEGVTEYLPVSSTGHLLLTQRLLKIPESEAANAFAICIQGGAIIAVLGIFRKRVGQFFAGLLGLIGWRASNENGVRLLRNLAVAFIPAMVLGMLFDDLIEEHLMGLWPIVIAWFIGGVAILVVDKWSRAGAATQTRTKLSIDEMHWPMALGIGLLQTVAMCPGTSRSLVTILGGLLVGLSLAAAVEFSFLLGVITLLAATAFKAVKSGDSLFGQYDGMTLVIGCLAAWISALIAIRWMLGFLTKHPMSIFGYYRIALAAVVCCCLYFGWISE